MALSPPNRRVKDKSRRPRRNNRSKPKVRLLIEELEARAVPSITSVGTTFAATEGSSFTGVVATFTDSDVNPPVSNFTTSIAWGDGTTSAGTVQATANGFQVTGSHTYADEGTQSVVVTINDVDGSSATANSTGQIADNDALTATGYNIAGTEGQAVNGVVATFTDGSYPANSPGDFTATINWGDGSTSTGTITTQGNLFVVRGSHTYEEGSYTIRVTIRDDDSGVATASTTSTATIADAALTATGTPVQAVEGQGFSGQVATFTDANPRAGVEDFEPQGVHPSFDTSTVTINWGDGSSTNILTYVNQPGGVGTPFVVSGSHTYAEEGSYTIQVTIKDNGGSQVIATSTATIADAPLTATGTPVNAVEGVGFSGQVATFIDTNPGAGLEDFSTPPTMICPDITGPGIPPCNPGLGTRVTIDWGDGTSFSFGNGQITQPGGVGTPFIVSGPTVVTLPGSPASSHTYLHAGSYTIQVTINDVGGSTTTTTTTAAVTDPDDIVARLGENGQIWTGVSTGSSFNSSLWGTLDPSITWVNVMSGDFTGDGRTDLAARDAATGNWWVAVSNGSSFTVSQWGAWAPNVSWADVQVGDFAGNGKMDIIGRPAGTGDWWVSTSTGSSFINSLWARWDPKETWVDVKVGDFNGDGKADITGRDLATGGWWTGLSSGSSFTTTLWDVWNPNVTWVDVLVGDFNGDGKADITARVKESGQWWTAISNGSGFSTSLWATWDPTVTWVDVKVGDFNGDGKADIIGRDLATGQWWVGLSVGFNCLYCLSPGVANAGPAGAAYFPPQFSNTLWGTWSPALTWVDVQVGDFNGDGKADITGRALESGQWWTGVSTGSSFNTSLWGTWVTNVTWADVRHGDFA